MFLSCYVYIISGSIVKLLLLFLMIMIWSCFGRKDSTICCVVRLGFLVKHLIWANINIAMVSVKLSSLIVMGNFVTLSFIVF